MPFDLHNGPLLRVTLLQLDEEEHQLLVTLHHIIADGWSLNVLIDEFSRLYASAVQGQTLELTPLPLRYADYGQWQREWLAQGEAERQLGYWKQQLGDEQPTLTLSTDHPRSLRKQHSASRYSLRLSADLSAALRNHGASVAIDTLHAVAGRFSDPVASLQRADRHPHRRARCQSSAP